jgi:hypothetical protein
MRFIALQRAVSSVLLLTVFASGLAPAQPSQIRGEYLCDECQGLLRVEPGAGSRVKVWLGVGGGSCGGEVLVNSAAAVSGSSVTVPRTENRRRCVTAIRFEGTRATVSDSCISPESEANSTCAMMGSYTKR